MNTQKQLNGKTGVAMAATASGLIGKFARVGLLALALVLSSTTQAQTLEVYLNSSGQLTGFNLSVDGYIKSTSGTSYRLVVAAHQGTFDEIEVYVNGSLDSLSSSVSNVAMVTVQTSPVSTSINTMGGGINGYIERGLGIISGSNVLFYIVGDFNSVGGGSNFYDFAIWRDDGTLGWDTCNAQLLGYDGYYPRNLTLNGSVIEVELAQPVDAYGGIVDDSSGWQAIPWTTSYIDWNITGKYWQNWR